MTATNKKGFEERVPGDTSHLSFVSTKSTEFAHETDIMKLDEMVARGGEQPISVGVIPATPIDGVFVSVESVDSASSTGIPNFDVLRTTCKQRIEGIPITSAYIGTVSGEGIFSYAEFKVPDFDFTIIGARGEFSISWRATKVANRLRMTIEGFDIVHIGLPIFDETRLISSDHEIFAVSPNHGSNRRVMSLLNGFEIESETVP